MGGSEADHAPFQRSRQACDPYTAEMAELIPGAKLVIMKDASHFAMWQKPDEFNANAFSARPPTKRS
jgi:pimeloyl-ACP methyl ester carboxylesterase